MTTSENSPLYRSYDGPYPYETLWGMGLCYLQIYEARGGIPVVIVTEMAGNPGASVTEATEALATAIWRELLPTAREGFRMIEVYLDARSPAVRQDGRTWAAYGGVGERLAEVSYSSEGDRLTQAEHRWIGRAEVEEMIGGPFSVPFTSSYEVR